MRIKPMKLTAAGSDTGSSRRCSSSDTRGSSDSLEPTARLSRFALETLALRGLGSGVAPARHHAAGGRSPRRRARASSLEIRSSSDSGASDAATGAGHLF